MSDDAEKLINESIEAEELSEIYNNGNYSCFAVKIKGASHIKDGTECQDSFKIIEADIDGSKIIISAVADGHGGKKYYLSKYGADILTSCICEVLIKIVYDNSRNNYETDILYKSIKEDMPAKLFTLWSETVLQDYAQRNKNGTEPDVEDEIEILAKYGTTAMFCLNIGKNFLFGKLDGNIVVCVDGEYFEPIGEDDELMGSEAYSMCKRKNALYKWGFGISYDTEFLSVSTDGLRNAFGDDDDNTDFINGIKSIQSYIIEHGCNKTKEALPAFLRRCSDNGSTDDITLVCFNKNTEKVDVNL